jgi:methyl-accepting chemotaxis protein
MAIARDLADGRLDAPVAHCAKDTTGQVLAALTDVSTRLNETISGIRTSTAEIETASREIAQGNTDLSERTERTAASLQETASSVTHLASTIEKNTETVGQVKEMASMAAQVAREGGEAVSEVVSSMDDINAQAKRISEIIGVIDGIAFQTNILALNAAVEAARAGEQGRGFAVVAQEVRSLAGRSSVAAKEIRSLIGTSVEQTSAGAEKASRAGHTMQRVVGAIDGVSRLVVEIAAASTQQSRAVVTVRSAIDGIDQSTQQNAALVEQAAAATISLKQQAAELLRAVSIFRTASPT